VRIVRLALFNLQKGNLHAKTLRVEYSGAWYHVLNRSTKRRPALKTNEHKEIFLEVVQQAAETYGSKCTPIV